MNLIFLAGMWLAGILAGKYFDWPALVLLLAAVPLPLIAIKRYRRRAVLACLGMALLAGGAFHYPFEAPGRDPGDLSYYNGEPVALRGTIGREVELRDTGQHLRLSSLEFLSDTQAERIEGDLLVFVPRYPQYAYGDELLLEGKLEDPPVFTDPDTGEIEFDYADYLALQDIYSVMVYPDVKVVSRGNGSPVLAGIYRLKERLASSLEMHLPEPEASLAKGVLLGMRSGIPESIRQGFSLTGTYHLLAISGLHLGIIAAIVLSLGLTFFGRRHYIYVWTSLAVIWLYALISGADPPVIRAAVMATTFLVVELAGRQKNTLPALGLAAAVMTAIDPRVLFTTSFQMSFAAVAGIVLIYPGLRGWGHRIIDAPGRSRYLRGALGLLFDSLAVSLAATLAVSPLAVHYFGILAPLGPMVTLLVLPALVAVIVSAGLTAAIGLVWAAASMLTGWVAWLFAHYMLVVVGAFAGLPGLSFRLDVTPGQIAGYYLGMLVIIWLIGRRRLIKEWFIARLSRDARLWQAGFVRRRVVSGLALSVLLVLTAGITSGCNADERFRVSFLDVGEGDAVLISQGRQQVLVDGGPSPQALLNQLGEVMPVWDRTIELMIMTHPHADHINGLVEVLERYTVSRVLYPAELDPSGKYESATLDRWLDTVVQKQIPATTAIAGQYFDVGRATVTVLNPGTERLSGTQSDTDNNGVVLLVEIDGFSFLLTGDLMWEGELDLVLDRRLETATVLKVGHHGSNTSSSLEFLTVAGPGFPVISVGQNSFGHPHQEVLDRLGKFCGEANIYRTDEDGRLTFIVDENRLWLDKGG